MDWNSLCRDGVKWMKPPATEMRVVQERESTDGSRCVTVWLTDQTLSSDVFSFQLNFTKLLKRPPTRVRLLILHNVHAVVKYGHASFGRLFVCLSFSYKHFPSCPYKLRDFAHLGFLNDVWRLRLLCIQLKIKSMYMIWTILFLYLVSHICTFNLQAHSIECKNLVVIITMEVIISPHTATSAVVNLSLAIRS